jgi:hypothetical protein
MDPENLFELIRHRPFEPFRLVVTDGKTYDVRHPETILVTRRTIFVSVPLHQNQERPPFDSVHIISLLHVTRLEPLDSVSA